MSKSGLFRYANDGDPQHPGKRGRVRFEKVSARDERKRIDKIAAAVFKDVFHGRAWRDATSVQRAFWRRVVKLVLSEAKP